MRIRTSVVLDDKVHRESKAKAALEGSNFSETVEQLLREWLKVPPKEPEQKES
jgi:hypothetical protein